MILVTVGTQLPFDRLVSAVDEWAASRRPADEVLAQVGRGRGDFLHLRCVTSLGAVEYASALRQARLIVTHAGMGTILSALELGKPVVAMPRDASRRECRDSHQVYGARRLEQMGLVDVAWHESDLGELIDRVLGGPPSRQARHGGAELTQFLASWIRDELGA